MKKEYLELKTCRTEKPEFIRGKEYIVLGTTTEHTYEYECEILPCYRVVNEKGGVEIVIPDQIFSPTNRLLQSIKEVVYLGIFNIESLIEGEVYSVFKIYEENGEFIYTTFDDSNKLKTYSASLFVSEVEYINMSKEELFDFKKVKEKELLKFEDLRKKEVQKALDEQLKIENDKKRDIQNALDEQDKLQNIKALNNLELEKFKEFIKILKPNKVDDINTTTFINETSKITNKINNLTIVFIVGCIIMLLLSILNNILIGLLINILLLLSNVSIGIYSKNKLSKNFIKVLPTNKKLDKESLNLMLSFSDDILLKLKKIELNLLILENAATVSTVTISLINESVSFCLESYKIKNTNLLKDIDIFLDKTLEYINTLVDGNNSDELFIEKHIYENVSSVINRNTNIFELMISDNKKIKEILNNDRIFK